ncbi:aminotransferase class I/II-fold pyridoxal phosphate-dependent enzyme [Janibacter melonis]|uniref:aminotransferase class I/II-fold pyridoxal phosphate-dependent enzyme n=1 Tax=Janibacter melonis TaxID=262209 RepID=UPI002095B6A2|nr:aminotransferase class I/II-fold pyridoxal phosphate-dependent enzyme [Janibacter melonis]
MSRPSPSRRSQVTPFEVMEVLARVARMREEGRDVISLCAGEPAGGAPTAVSRAAAAIHESREPLTYTPALGLTELRSAIAQHYRDWYGLDLPAERVAVTTGSSGAFVLTFLAAFDQGDRVALARPGYPAYRNILSGLGCEVVDLDCGPEVRYQPTVEQLAEVHARQPLAGLVLASPANPTGTMIGRAELTAIARWCTEHGVRLVSDEIYHGITYPEPGAPTPRRVRARGRRRRGRHQLLQQVLGMTGWRLGWAVVPHDLVGPVDALAGNIALCPPAPAQMAALSALTDEALLECEEAVAGFARTREVLLELAPRLAGARRPRPMAPSTTTPTSDRSWSAGPTPPPTPRRCSRRPGRRHPGGDFDERAGDRHVRLSLAAGPEAVAEAVERIVAWQAGL